ncbi:MAG: pitrilysin family protein [Xanthomonadales bacterium]|nr:pitrilysin family protein [Xanthomonadales bacterium]
MRLRWIAAGAAVLLLYGCGKDSVPQESQGAANEVTDAPTVAASPVPEPQPFTVDFDYHTLDNGLKVILSQDTTAPVVTVAVYYNIGFRIEPKDRTGFAHLFEHMMFQGSENLGKMEFISLVNANGGVLNGSTRFDYTNYFAIVPAHKLETMLWAEADRMRGLDITDENLANQQGVVKNEVKVNVLNQPYGGFPWLWLPQYANENWYNSHNFYGDLDDLDAASLSDVADFFARYYAPNNAALAIVGDFDPAEALAMVEKYFANIPAAPEPIELPDISEPRQEAEKTESMTDALATRPGFAFAYHVPERLTPEWYAMGLIDQMLLQGDDSLLHQALVQQAGITDGVGGGINALLGNMLNYQGPMLWSGSFIHDAGTSTEEILLIIDGVIDQLKDQPVSPAELARALVKWRSDYYDQVSATFGFGRADLLASLALFDDDPGLLNEFEKGMQAVTPELIQQTAQEYLRSSNRTTLALVAGAAESAAEAQGSAEQNNGEQDNG